MSIYPNFCGQPMNLHQIILLIWLQIVSLIILIFSHSQINNIRKSLSLTPIFDAYHPTLKLIYPLTTSPAILVESCMMYVFM